MRKLRILFGLAIAAALIGCSGGDDNTIVDTSIPTTDPNVPVIEIATLDVLTSNPQIPSDAALPVTITALLKDASNNFVAGQSVAFSADSGGIVVTQSETDDNGRATAELSAAGDPTNRTITVTATVTSGDTTLTNTVAVSVTGTQLTITGPTSLVQGATTATYTIVLADAAGNGIAGEAVTVNSAIGNALASTTLTTDFSGQAQVEYTPVNGGTDTFTASALGETTAATIQISADTFSFTAPDADTEIELNTAQTVTTQWIQNNNFVSGRTIEFSTTRGMITPTTVVTNANGEATVSIQANNSGPATITAKADPANDGPTATLDVEFVAVMPDTIEVQADPFTVSPNSQSTITAVVRDPQGNLVKNKSVTFTLDDVTGGVLSVGTAVTDSQGRAQTFYTSSAAVSSVDGVTITASVDEDPTINDFVNLTVAGRELFFTFGTGNSIAEDDTQAQYVKTFVVQVTDADGRAVSDVEVSMSVNSVTYIKGFWWPNIIADSWNLFARARCADEDSDRDGFLDAGEDFNGNGSIDAGNVATVIPGAFVSDENGFGVIDLFYAQQYGGYLEVELEARASVQGTEFSERQFFSLELLADDVNDLEQSPPGTNTSVTDFDESNIPATVLGAIGGPGAGSYTLISSPFGYNQDCSVWEFTP